MRETFRVALVALALAAVAAIGCRTSALQPLHQTSGTTNDLPGFTGIGGAGTYGFSPDGGAF